MSDVPAEILGEILSRLPVAPLLRFRCVSKQWKSLIDSNHFLQLHLNLSRKSDSHHNIIMRTRNLFSLDFDLLNETNWGTFQELSHPLKTPSYATEVLGSCDGLLALVNGEEEQAEEDEKNSFFWNPFVKKFHIIPDVVNGVEEHEKDIILWNPSAKRFLKLPFTGIEHPESQYNFTCSELIVYGFGYDFVSDDYKLVRIVQFYGESSDEFSSEVKVYNLKSDSWRRIPDFPYYLKYRRWHGKLVNGALHWIVSRKVKSDTDGLIAAFDLGTEECRLVPLPEYAGDDVHMNVVVLGGCLSIMCSEILDHTDIWVMKEYGVQESWSFLFSLSQSDVFPPKFGCMLPIAYSKCGSKVLVALDGRLLLWYDLDKNYVDQLEVQFPSENCFDFYPCLQSLVLLNNGTRDFNLFSKSNNLLSKGFKLKL